MFVLGLYLSLAQSAFRVPFRQSKTVDSLGGQDVKETDISSLVAAS